MRIKFEAGDKILESDYNHDDYLSFKTLMMLACIENHWKFIEDNKSCEILDEKQNISLTIKKDNRIELAGALQRTAKELPIYCSSICFDMDFISLVRINTIAKYMKTKKIKDIDWVDNRNIIHKGVTLNTLEEVITLYNERMYIINEKYRNILIAIENAKDEKALNAISFDELIFLVRAK